MSALAVLALFFASAGEAAAHTRSQSRSTWWLEGPRASATFSVASLEVTRLGSVEALDLPSTYARHLEETVAVYAESARCELSGAPTVLPAQAGFLRVELGFHCEQGPVSAIEVGSFMFVAPSHLHLADLRWAHGERQDYLFTDVVRTRVVGGTGGPADSGSFRDYVEVGIEHILAGWDHLAFVAVLLLLCVGRREVVLAITGFTIGHSLTLAGAVMGWLLPNVAAVEALIGFTIAIAALESSVVGWATAKRAAAAATSLGLLSAFGAAVMGSMTTAVACAGLSLFAACYLLGSSAALRTLGTRLVLSCIFGLIHGLGFASVLIDMDLPRERLIAALLGFNVGVELGQLLVVFALWALGAAMVKVTPLKVLAPIRTVAASALGGLGVFWLMSRALV